MSPEEEKAQAVAHQEAEDRKKTVIDTVITHCNEACDFEELRPISAAVKDGNKLTCKIISGGVTNYSFKVELEEPHSGVPALFVKMSFSYALWDPARDNYDLMRTQNEFELMKSFKEMMGGADKAPVPTPYFCFDVDGMKLLITAWSDADEQWANQFIDGKVDSRITPQAAAAFATLNLSEVTDPMFNDNVRPCMRGMIQASKGIFGQTVLGEGAPTDDFIKAGRELGQEKFDALMDAMDKAYMKREVLSHSDCQPFNLLVEKKPSVSELEDFGPNGSFVICDWEMAYVGPPGRDPGIIQAWPLACALSHASLGHKAEVDECLKFTTEFWDLYAKALVEKGSKDEAYLREVFVDGLTWTSLYFCVAWYFLGINMTALPSNAFAEQHAATKGAMAALGLKLLEFAFSEPDMSLEEVLAWYNNAVEASIEKLMATARGHRQRPRRASVLRETGRRVSDAFAYDKIAKRMSEASDANEMTAIVRDMVDPEAV